MGFFSPKTGIWKSHETLTKYVCVERTVKKNQKVSKAVSKGDIIWIKGTKGNKSCEKGSSRNPKSPLQEKGSALKTFLTPRASLTLHARHRENWHLKKTVPVKQHLASPLLSPSSKYKGIRTHSQIAGVEEQKKKVRKLDEKPVFPLPLCRLSGLKEIWGRGEIQALMKFRILTVTLSHSFYISEM